jgi:uncharacterized protein (DUF58 family)
MKNFLLKNPPYRIIFRGKGLEFDGYRDFTPDDDAGDIDWKASTRGNKILVRKYIEERDLKIMFIVDISENMVFGSTEKLKCEYCAEFCAALSHLIISEGDNVGFIFFNDKIRRMVSPKGGNKRFNAFLDELSNADIYGGPSRLNEILDFLIDYLSPDLTAVIIVSDFIKLNKETARILSLYSGKFETMAFVIKDPLDKTLPDYKGEVVVENPETKEKVVIDPSVVKKDYEKKVKKQEELMRKVFMKSGVDFLELDTSKKFTYLLSEFLMERAEQGRYIAPK